MIALCHLWPIWLIGWIAATIHSKRSREDLVRITTAQRTVITKLRRKPEIFTETASGHFGATEWAEFTCPKDRFNLGAAARPKREISEAQREAALANVFRARAAREAS